MEILIGELPGDVTEEQLREYLQPFGAIDALTMSNDGNESRTSATVDMPVSAAVAGMICEKIHKKSFDGHTPTAEVMLFFK